MIEAGDSSSQYWLKIGNFTLRVEHKDALCSDQWLNDYLLQSVSCGFTTYNRSREIP